MAEEIRDGWFTFMKYYVLIYNAIFFGLAAVVLLILLVVSAVEPRMIIVLVIAGIFLGVGMLISWIGISGAHKEIPRRLKLNGIISLISIVIVALSILVRLTSAETSQI